jgi:hypothetical protein
LHSFSVIVSRPLNSALAFNHTIDEQNKKGGVMAEKYVGINALTGRVERFFISFIAPTYVVTVSGNTPCGHMLLNIGGHGGTYTHVLGGDRFPWINGYPYFMNQKGYERYLRENKRMELKRVQVNVPNPAKAKRKLNKLKYQQWFWKGLTDNCVSYVETILQAGGAGFDLQPNCPKYGKRR